MSLFGICSENLQLSGDDSNTITKIEKGKDWDNAIYIKDWINSSSNKTYNWKITNNKAKYANSICIGLITNQHHHKADDAIYNHKACYAFFSNGDLDHGEDLMRKGPKFWAPGRVITVSLDLVNKQISITVDDGEKHILFENIDKSPSVKYKLAITLYDTDDSVSVSFIDNRKRSRPALNRENEPISKKQRIDDQDDIDQFLNKQRQELTQFMKTKVSTINDRNNELKQDNDALKKDITKLKESNNTLQADNTKLNKQIKEYEDKMESMKKYDLGNMRAINEIKLKQLEDKMNENLQKIRRKREELLEQEKEKSLCMLCYTNKKNILIQGCNHFDICEECKNNLPRKTCPRCQSPFKNTIKLNHL